MDRIQFAFNDIIFDNQKTFNIFFKNKYVLKIV